MQTDSLFYRLFQNWPQRAINLLQLPYEADSYQHDKLDREIIEFIETVLVYKLPNLSREEIRIMLGLNDVKLKETRFYQEIAEEDMQEGERLLLKKQLGKRFGPLQDWVLLKLEQAGTEQLEYWGERILDVETLDDVFGGL